MNILVFAPHNDDEVLGVGGTIARFSEEGHKLYVCEVTSGPKYKMMQQEATNAHKMLGVEYAFFLNLPVSALVDMKKTELNARIDEIVKKVRPEIVFMPFIGDMHFDHRMVAEAVLVAARPVNECSVKKVYMYETLSETGWNVPVGENSFIPNFWIDIGKTIEKKIEAMLCYQSQLRGSLHPRSTDCIRALAKYRGATVGLNYAESFMLVREIL